MRLANRVSPYMVGIINEMPGPTFVLLDAINEAKLNAATNAVILPVSTADRINRGNALLIALWWNDLVDFLMVNRCHTKADARNTSVAALVTSHILRTNNTKNDQSGTPAERDSLIRTLQGSKPCRVLGM